MSGAPEPNVEGQPVEADSGATGVSSQWPLASRGGGGAVAPEALSRVGGLRLRAAVEVGSVELPLRQIAALGAGSIVRLDRLATEPADLVVNGRCFARGEMVIVDGRLGLRITELLDGQAGAA
jgi:flagellar motor switch protein FliN/FliY